MPQKKPQSFADFILKWTLLNDALKPIVPDFPIIAEDQRKLEQLLLEGEQLRMSLENMRAQSRKSTRLHRELFDRGRDVAGRLTAAMQFRLGFTAEELASLGIRPRRRRRKQPETPPQDSLAPAAPPAEPLSQ